LSKFSKKESLSTTNSFLALAPGFISENNYSSQFYTRDIITDNSFITRSSDKSISLTPIPYSIDEVKEIGQLFKQKSLKTTIFTASEATQANLTNHLLSTDIIHIATHGISRAEHQSGLFFTQNNDDGFLSLQELYHLKVNANLIVLSACKSGTGEIIEGEGVMALPRGFFYAGTSNVMASLWKIHDKKTKELMVTFYKHLLQDNVSYSEALRLAKLECIKKGFLPIDWAGFILISNQS